MISANEVANFCNSGGISLPWDCNSNISAVIATKASFKAVGTTVVAISGGRDEAAIIASIVAPALGLRTEITFASWAEDWTIALIITCVTTGDKVIVTFPDPRLDLITETVSELTPALVNPSDNAVTFVAEAAVITTMLSAVEKLLFEMVNVTDSFPVNAIWVVPIWDSADAALA